MPKPDHTTAMWTSADAAGDIINIKHDEPALASCLTSATNGMCTLYVTVYGAERVTRGGGHSRGVMA